MRKTPYFDFVTYAGTKAFKRHPRNRAIDKKHVQEIKKQMIEAFTSMPAIVINIITMVIIDGQHRLAAFKALVESGFLPEDAKLPVMYVSIPVENELDQIIAAQLHARRWKPEDFIQSYVNDGNESYVKLYAWCKTHALCVNGKNNKPRYAAAMMKGKNCQKVLQNGDFTVTDEEIARAEEIHSEIITICDVLNIGNTGTWLEAMIISWYNNRGLHTFNEWYSMLKRHKKALANLPKQKLTDWNSLFAQVDNWINKEKLAA